MYEDILLSTYSDIAKSGNLELLVISGKWSAEELNEAWEKIVLRNAEENGDMEIVNYVELLQAYGKLVSDYTLVKASLFKLLLVVDDATVAWLATKRYKIKTDGTHNEFLASINAALAKSNSYITHITARKLELEKLLASQSEKSQHTIEQALAALSAGLGFSVPTDVTLARFNEYKKVLKKKFAPKEQTAE